jgi:hypothetical protein
MPTIVPSSAFLTTRPARPQPVSGSSGHVFSVASERCPACGDIVSRIPRRPIDRILSVFVSMRRYRCPNVLCVWEGNVRDRPLGTEALLNSVGLSSATERDRR